MKKILASIIILLALTSIASASYYLSEPVAIKHDYSSSSYIHPDALPRADIFYTPYNAYRTYYDAIYYPIKTTKVVHVYEPPPVRVQEHKTIVVTHPYPKTYTPCEMKSYSHSYSNCFY